MFSWGSLITVLNIEPIMYVIMTISHRIVLLVVIVDD